jgi:hypothetical protein
MQCDMFNESSTDETGNCWKGGDAALKPALRAAWTGCGTTLKTASEVVVFGGLPHGYAVSPCSFLLVAQISSTENAEIDKSYVASNFCSNFLSDESRRLYDSYYLYEVSQSHRFGLCAAVISHATTSAGLAWKAGSPFTASEPLILVPPIEPEQSMCL